MTCIYDYIDNGILDDECLIYDLERLLTDYDVKLQIDVSEQGKVSPHLNRGGSKICITIFNEFILRRTYNLLREIHSSLGIFEEVKNVNDDLEIVYWVDGRISLKSEQDEKKCCGFDDLKCKAEDIFISYTGLEKNEQSKFKEKFIKVLYDEMRDEYGRDRFITVNNFLNYFSDKYIEDDDDKDYSLKDKAINVFISYQGLDLKEQRKFNELLLEHMRKNIIEAFNECADDDISEGLKYLLKGMGIF